MRTIAILTLFCSAVLAANPQLIDAIEKRLAVVNQAVTDSRAKLANLNKQLAYTPAVTNIPIYSVQVEAPPKVRNGRAVSGMCKETRYISGYKKQPNPQYQALQSRIRSASNDLTQAVLEQGCLSNQLASARK